MIHTLYVNYRNLLKGGCLGNVKYNKFDLVAATITTHREYALAGNSIIEMCVHLR